jgi:hypothetical protein
MIYTYQELLSKKEKGEHLDWNTITKEQLENLFINEEISNSLIANLYEVPAKTVSSKRSRLGITMNSPKYLYKRYQENNSSLFYTLNTNSKEELSKVENIDWISKALTHYLFRNGPVEDMHSAGKLSQTDMKTLNKYMVNRIAGLLKLANNGEWLKIVLMLKTLEPYGREWDKAEYDTEEIELIFQHMFEISKERNKNLAKD